MKTKPTQQAVRMLNEAGIFPDFLLCRAPQPLDDVRKKKLEQNANIIAEHVISAPDVDNIYKVPQNFEKEELGKKILKRLNLQPKKQPDCSVWNTLISNMQKPKNKIKIAIVGKYLDIGNYALSDSYVSIRESITHASANCATQAEIVWVDSKTYEKNPEKVSELKNYHGVIVPGGFGSSGVEGKIAAIKFCRENNIPYLGLCYGMQLAVIEFARNVCGMKDAHTTEVDKNTTYPVIDIQPSQRELMEQSKYGATMRLGAYAAILKDKTKVLDLYKSTSRLAEDKALLPSIEKFRLGIIKDAKNVVIERHRHRYEVNPKYIEQLEKKGLVFSGYHVREDGTKLMEYAELPKHPFFIGTQAHPEFKSRLEKPSPLFFGFVQACVQKK
jgi:CTP synthase